MAVWPAAQSTIFAAAAELLQDPAAQPMPEQLLQPVLSHLEETWDSTNGVSWSEAESQISSQHLPDAWQTLVVTALQTTANLEITVHRLGCTCAQVNTSSAAAEQHNGLIVQKLPHQEHHHLLLGVAFIWQHTISSTSLYVLCQLMNLCTHLQPNALTEDTPTHIA